MLVILGSVFIFLAAMAGADIESANEPARIGVGARVLGMGRAYVGLADDISSLFMNPAGITSFKHQQFTSMSGKYINEYDYFNVAAAVPLPGISLGIGCVGNGLSFFGPSVTFEGQRIIPSTTEGVTYGYYNRAYMFSAAKDFSSL